MIRAMRHRTMKNLTQVNAPGMGSRKMSPWKRRSHRPHKAKPNIELVRRGVKLSRYPLSAYKMIGGLS